MHRHEVIQSFIDLYRSPAYLEIGVNEGHTFKQIRAETKFAVDPDFLFDVDAAKLEEPTSRFIRSTSDDYFAEATANGLKFDVIFIDGLHTFDQVLRDILNSIFTLRSGGVIVVDDVIPTDYAASVADIKTMADIRKATGSRTFDWMGDVYKAVFFVRHFIKAFEYATVQENHGQMVMWRRTSLLQEACDNLSLDAVLTIAFKDVILQRDKYQTAPFADILRKVSSSRKQD